MIPPEGRASRRPAGMVAGGAALARRGCYLERARPCNEEPGFNIESGGRLVERYAFRTFAA
jgi:hypothetical protein